MKGRFGLTGQSPCAAWMSVWHRPEVSIRTTISPGPGSGSGTSSISSGLVKSWTTAAFMAVLRTSRVPGSGPDLVNVGRRGRRKVGPPQPLLAARSRARSSGAQVLQHIGGVAPHGDGDPVGPGGDGAAEHRAQVGDLGFEGRP